MVRHHIYHTFIDRAKELSKINTSFSEVARIIYYENPQLKRISVDNFRRALSKYFNRQESMEVITTVKPKRLFFDIETSPNIVYSWRIGYNLTITPDNIIDERRIICIAWKWEGEDDTYALHWDEFQNDKQMLVQFINVMNKADEVVGHNSDRFDIKWVRTRCYFHEIPVFPNYRSFDTLKKARSNFNFNSNKLDYIAKFSGLEGKMITNYKLWVDVMDGCEDSLKYMVDYCKKDVIELEKVFNKMNNYVTNNTNHAVLKGEDKHCCPECGGEGSFEKIISTPMGTKQVLMKCDCGKYYKISFKSYMNKYEKSIQQH